jgi:transposase-like protein
VSRHFENTARRTWWSVHVDAWQRSGLSQRRYCRQHRLDTTTFARWLKVLVDAESLRLQRHFDAEKRHQRRPRRLSTDKRNRAVQAFWAMHVEAMTWCGLSVGDYATAHRLSANSLRRWRDLLDAGEVEIDWRARLHPSALPQVSTRTSIGAKESGAHRRLTSPSGGGPSPDSRRTRRAFDADQKRAVALECDRPGASVSAVARAYGIATSVLFRWRAELGLGRKGKVVLAAVRTASSSTKDASVLHDLLPMPDGMAAVDLPDGRRVFAPLDVDPDAVRRHIADRETTPW